MNELEDAFANAQNIVRKEQARIIKRQNRKELAQMLAKSFGVGLAIGAVVVAIDYARNKEDYNQED